MEVVNSAYESVALMFIKDVVEQGLTLREVADKYHYCAGTVSSYIKNMWMILSCLQSTREP